jgi:uncharacterized membrane protein YfcA
MCTALPRVHASRRADATHMTILTILAIGLVVGVLVGLLGIGAGAVLVPALVYLLGYD